MPNIWRKNGGIGPIRPDGGAAPFWCDTCPCVEEAPSTCPYSHYEFKDTDWTAEGDEYKATLTWSPEYVTEARFTILVHGTAGALNTGEYDYDALNDLLYVRLSDDTAPGINEVAAFTGPARLRLQTYNDGDISGCTDCTDKSGGNIWDGMFPNRFDACTWGPNANYDQIADKELIASEELWVTLDTANRRWEVVVSCARFESPVDFRIDMWLGHKSFDTTPVGTYTYSSGCAGSPTSFYIESY